MINLRLIHLLACLLTVITTTASAASRYRTEVDSVLCNASCSETLTYLKAEIAKSTPTSEPEKSLHAANLVRLTSRTGQWLIAQELVARLNLDATRDTRERYRIIDALAANQTLHNQGYLSLDVKYTYAPLILKYDDTDFCKIIFDDPHFQHLYGISLANLGQYEDALTNFRNAVEGIDKTKYSATELDMRIRLIEACISCSQYEEAGRQLDSYEKRLTEMCSNRSIYTAIFFRLSSQIHQALGDFTKAGQALRETMTRYLADKEMITGGSPSVFILLGINALAMEEYESALDLFNMAGQYASNMFGKRSHAAVEADIYKLDVFNAMGRNEEYDSLHKEVDSHNFNLKKNPALIHLSKHNYLTFTDNLINNGMYGLACMIAKLNEDLYNSINAATPIEYRNLYNTLGYVSLKSDAHTDAANYFRKQLDMDRQYAHDVFMFLPEAQRAMYWARMEPLMNRLFCANRNGTASLADGTVIELKNHADTMATGALLYDASLLNKGLMLEASVNLRRLMQTSGNDELRTLSDRLASLRRRQASNSPLTPEEENEARDIETRIMKESRQYGDFMRFASFTWQDIRDRLGKHEVAVEFVMSREDNVEYYSAELLRHDSQQPVHIFLFALPKGNTTFDRNDLYSSRTLYNKVWKKLLQHVSPGETIYFSPAGRLYSIAIEHALTPSGARINTEYTPVRLSSTRELVMNRPDNSGTRTVLYGGLNYDTDIDDMELVAQSIDHTRGISRAIDGSPASRKPWSYLPGTLTEVNAIAETSSASGQRGKALVLTDSEGTEESFKQLSQTDVNILHIATHGFYLPPKETNSMVTANYAVDDNSLYRSALVLSGGNNGWLFPDLIPDNLDDGILTAKEISEMDLSGTGLVVMSACQTGLGDVSNEGVFGLQRAFKLAGARTLIMSLAPVHDDATRLLMSEFYSSLARGESLRAAFNHGQKAVQQSTFTIGDTELPGSDPRFWAPFVIMD